MANQLLIPYLPEIDSMSRETYTNLSLEEKQLLHEVFAELKDVSEFTDTYRRVKNIIFRVDPPTPQQFLDPKEGWLSKKIVDSIYDHIKDDFLNITDPNKKYTQVSMYGSTRLGKTFLARLLDIYTITYIHSLRDPALYYKLSPLTSLAIYFLSFKYEKTKQLYLDPMYKILDNSERFYKIKFQDKVQEEQYTRGLDTIIYSQAARVGQITLDSGLKILVGNDNPNDILGADVLQAYISEIAFFIDEAGATEDEIFRLYTDALSRIKATVGNEYLAFVYLDTSANFADSKIENHIIKNLQYDPSVYFKWRSQWQARPYLFPKWQKSGETFKIITGNGDIPARIITNPAQINGIPPDLVLDIPIDAKSEFELNLIKSIKDIAGHPTSNESKFIQDSLLIPIMFNNEHLRNIEGGIIADSKENPQNLIWNKVQHIFFNKVNEKGSLLFYRAPHEMRFVTLDTAFSAKGDVYGFCMGHLEWSRERKTKLAIVDMLFPILPGEGGINLTAVEQFIYDLKDKGHVPIKYARTDTFQSAQMKQNLERFGVDTNILSVDRSLVPYQELYTSLVNETVKVGKNIFLKNNLLSLERIRNENGHEKVDHSKGETNNRYLGDFDNSNCGINAKDVADPLASFVYTAFNINIMPGTIYEDENARYKVVDIDHINSEKMVKEAYSKLTAMYRRRVS